jgi:hypothetical protein
VTQSKVKGVVDLADVTSVVIPEKNGASVSSFVYLPIASVAYLPITRVAHIAISIAT